MTSKEPTGNEQWDEYSNLVSSGQHLCILQGDMYVCDTCVNALGFNVRWDRLGNFPAHLVPTG